MKGKPVFCLGLTPALQRTVLLNSLLLNQVNRTRQVMESASGKAVNIARSLVTLGTPADVSGFNGGDTGRRMLECLKVYGVGNALTPMAPPTRICTTLLDQRTKEVTEIIEEAPPVDLQLIKQMSNEASKRLMKAPLVIIAGTLPPFVSDHFYIKFAQDAEKAHVPLIIDSHGTALLHTLPFHPLLAKMNLRELGTTFGQKMTSEELIFESMREIFAKGAQNVLVTDGPNPAYLMTAEGISTVPLPKIRNCLNPIGSGDCATAGFAHAYLNKKPIAQCARYAMACGGANAETLLPSDFAVRRVSALYKDLQAL